MVARMITPRAIISGFIGAHEGALSLNPDDNGNWYDPARYLAKPKQLPQRRGMGLLVGSKFGVTAYSLVHYRVRKGAPLATAIHVTRPDINAITFDLAIEIGFELFFLEPALDRLDWNRVTPSVVDKAWGSGPGTAVELLQQLIGVAADGCIGPGTVTAYAAWIAQLGEERAAAAWCSKRLAFDHTLATNGGPHDPDAAFENGWDARSRSFLPGTPWWRQAGATAAGSR